MLVPLEDGRRITFTRKGDGMSAQLQEQVKGEWKTSFIHVFEGNFVGNKVETVIALSEK